MKTKINKLVSKIAKREGKKSQVKIGDIREILGIMADVFNDEHKMLLEFLRYCCSRTEKKPKAKK